MNEFEQEWRNICRIHLFTKHYILLAEELDLDGNTIIQPLKEHRDAYDHVIRVYAAKFGLSQSGTDDEYYRKNMSKAIGHEYRAFFDTADWVSLVIRERINKLLRNKDRAKLEKCYPDYPEFRKMLLNIPDEIVNLREKKDIGKHGASLECVVESYSEVLDKLYKGYKALVEALTRYDTIDN